MTNAAMLRIDAGRLVTCDPARGEGVAALDDASLVLDAGKVVSIGDRVDLAARFADATVFDARGCVVTPGLVDAHTHAVWAGSRGSEYAMRMRGADYEQIGRAGGGIVASMRAVRETPVEALSEQLAARLARMARMGVTTVEIKSGYGLDEGSERKQLEAVAMLQGREDLPAVVPTYLGLHALPPEAAGDRDAYAKRCRQWLDPIARDGLARYVDAYVDRSAFSVEQVRPTLERARELGLGVRIHAGQFADVGGAELAAELGAASVDHLEQVSDEGIARLAEAGVRAILLPVASFSLGQQPPPVERLRGRVELGVASDANPGTAPTESLPLAMALAARCYGMTTSEIVLGATRVAAASLDCDAGMLREGGMADVVVWDLPHEDDLMQPWGVAKTKLVLRGGNALP